MEKPNIFNGDKLTSTDKKGRLADKIEDMWKSENGVKNQSKKLVLKLQTNGTEKRKLHIKLESGGANVHANNYILISELLKEFFNSNE